MDFSSATSVASVEIHRPSSYPRLHLSLLCIAWPQQPPVSFLSKTMTVIATSVLLISSPLTPTTLLAGPPRRRASVPPPLPDLHLHRLPLFTHLPPPASSFPPTPPPTATAPWLSAHLFTLGSCGTQLLSALFPDPRRPRQPFGFHRLHLSARVFLW